ncbi:hypothetical protein D9M68_917140 [compost metagenome]
MVAGLARRWSIVAVASATRYRGAEGAIQERHELEVKNTRSTAYEVAAGHSEGYRHLRHLRVVAV